MKKLFFALALLIITSHGAFAASCDPNTDKWNIGQWCVTTDDTLIPSTSAAVQLVTETVTVANTPRQLQYSESGKVITDMGGRTAGSAQLCPGGSKFTLPRAAAGLTFTIMDGTKCFSTVDTLDTNDIILNSISGTVMAAGESLKSPGQAGDSVTLTSTSANQWSVTDMRGSWTNNGAN